MTIRKRIVAATVLLSAVPLAAQIAIEAEGTRKSSRLLYTVGVAKPAELCIHYAPVAWRPAYGLEVDQKADQHFRLGTGFWTTLHSNVAAKFGQKAVPANTWYLGLHRSAQGAWSLTFMDASKVQRTRQTSGSTRDVKPDVVVPMELKKGFANAETLSIRLGGDRKDYGRADLVLRWGEYQLRTGFRVAVEKGCPAGEPAFAKFDAKRVVTTKSGLKYEELRPGIGERAGATDRVKVHYVGWLTDGTRFDSTFMRKQAATFPLNGVIRGWQEGIQLMKPGAVFRFEIPPDLGYGARGAGPIKPNSTLVFWVELLAIE